MFNNRRLKSVGFAVNVGKERNSRKSKFIDYDIKVLASFKQNVNSTNGKINPRGAS